MKSRQELLVTFALTAALAAAQNPPHLLPAPSGPYAVGRTSLEWTDASRPDKASPGGYRQLVVWLWYPAEKTQEPPALWQPGKWGDLYWTRLLRSHPESAAIKNRYPIQSILCHSQADLPVLAGRVTLPLLLFSPGGGELPLNYASLIEDLASHGYVIAGIVPAYSESCVYSDGRILDRQWRSREEKVREMREDNPGKSALADLRFALNQLEKLPRIGPWRDKIDFAPVGAIGHSLGGGASLDVARSDSRVRAVVALDGGDFRNLAKPVLYLHSAGEHSRDQLAADLAEPTRSFLETARPGYDLWIRGAAHSFSSDHFVLPYRPRTVELMGTIEPTRALAITRELVRGFFDKHLNGVNVDASIGPSSRFPEIFVLVDPK